MMIESTIFLMEYTVTESDSIERIAAIHDCTVGELMKMNRLGTRMVFPGQKLVVPRPMGEDDAFDAMMENRRIANQSVTSVGSSAQTNEGDGIRRGPGTAVQVRGRSATLPDPSSGPTPIRLATTRAYSEKAGSADMEADTDCLKRFIKLKVKEITEMDGTVTGTLLVTPNALMFDPDVVHPLVLENGQDLYIMMARMEEVLSVGMFKDVTALIDMASNREQVYDCVYQVSPIPESSAFDEETVSKEAINLVDDVFEKTDVQSPKIFFDEMNLGERIRNQETQIGHVASNPELPLIAEERSKLVETDLDLPRTTRRTYSDLSNSAHRIESGLEISEMKATASSRKEQQYSAEPSTSRDDAHGERNYSPLSKIGKTLSSHANTIRGSVTSGAERVTQTAVSGTKSVAQGVVSQSKVVAGTLQTGIQTSAKMAASHAKTAVDAVAAMPQGIANMGSGLFATSQHTEAQINQENTMPTTRKGKNLATLLSLKEKTQQKREEAVKNKHLARFVCATSMDEMPNLFKPVHELLSTTQTSSATEKATLTEPPYYMIVRLNRKKKYGKGRSATISSMHSSSGSGEHVTINHTRNEFCFAIPREKVDGIYHFLLQWNPEKYEAATHEESQNELVDQKRTRELLEDNGFVVLDLETDERLSGEKPPSRVFGSSYLNREWEIVTVQEMCRRLSLDQLDKVVLPLPDGATSSQILDEAMIRQMVDVLPARAAGYPWVNIYNSEKHGFSLHTFYRKMIDWNEEMSPVLLIIRDCEGNVFGAIVSTTLRPCDHFFGTGDSCLLFKYVNDPEISEKELRTYPWSGQNQFFVKASVDSLSVGAGGGHYGLWLDADLNHGRTQVCETFQNEQLAGENEDFTIQFVEAFGFRME